MRIHAVQSTSLQLKRQVLTSNKCLIFRISTIVKGMVHMANADLRNKQIFIIEDDAANLDIMLVYLRGAGAVAHFGRWDTDTLQNMEKVVPLDAILLDLSFPNNITGFDIFGQLRSLSFLDDVPIIAVTALNMDEALPRAKQQGFAGYINKPLQRSTFTQAVSDILDGHEVWGTVNT